MNKFLPLLHDDIGSIMNFALAIGILIAVVIAFFVYNLIKSSKNKKRLLISIIVGVFAFFLAIYAIIFGLANFSG